MNRTRPPRLGIDIGRVIIAGSHSHGGDTAFFSGDEATMLATPEVAGAVDCIADLVDAVDGDVWLISKCGQRIQDRTRRWLRANDFFVRTGVRPQHLRFCRTRGDKRLHCVELGLTHFVDDHPEVHAAIRGTVDHQYFFGPQRRLVPGWAHHAPTWPDALRQIRGTLARRDARDGMAG